MLEKIRTLLPVGSVVTLKGVEGKAVISGYMQETEDPETGKITRYEYMGLRYPFGHTDGQSICAFNREMIDRVLHRGYDDNARILFLQKLSDAEEQAADQELHFLEEL